MELSRSEKPLRVGIVDAMMVYKATDGPCRSEDAKRKRWRNKPNDPKR